MQDDLRQPSPYKQVDTYATYGGVDNRRLIIGPRGELMLETPTHYCACCGQVVHQDHNHLDSWDMSRRRYNPHGFKWGEQ